MIARMLNYTAGFYSVWFFVLLTVPLSTFSPTPSMQAATGLDMQLPGK